MSLRLNILALHFALSLGTAGNQIVHGGHLDVPVSLLNLSKCDADRPVLERHQLDSPFDNTMFQSGPSERVDDPGATILGASGEKSRNLFSDTRSFWPRPWIRLPPQTNPFNYDGKSIASSPWRFDADQPRLPATPREIATYFDLQ